MHHYWCQKRRHKSFIGNVNSSPINKNGFSGKQNAFTFLSFNEFYGYNAQCIHCLVISLNTLYRRFISLTTKQIMPVDTLGIFHKCLLWGQVCKILHKIRSLEHKLYPKFDQNSNYRDDWFFNFL